MPWRPCGSRTTRGHCRVADVGIRTSLARAGYFFCFVFYALPPQEAVASDFSGSAPLHGNAQERSTLSRAMPMTRFPTQELRKRLEAISRELDVVRNRYCPGDPRRLDILMALTRELFAVQYAFDLLLKI